MEANDTLDRKVALTVALLASFMGVCKIKDDNINQAMQQAQADKIDHWAFYQARSESRPVILSAPMDVQSLDAAEDALDGYRPSGEVFRRQRVVPDPEELAAAADVIAASRRPVVLVGRGAMSSGAGEAISPKRWPTSERQSKSTRSIRPRAPTTSRWHRNWSALAR